MIWKGAGERHPKVCRMSLQHPRQRPLFSTTKWPLFLRIFTSNFIVFILAKLLEKASVFKIKFPDVSLHCLIYTWKKTGPFSMFRLLVCCRNRCRWIVVLNYCYKIINLRQKYYECQWYTSLRVDGSNIDEQSLTIYRLHARCLWTSICSNSA